VEVCSALLVWHAEEAASTPTALASRRLPSPNPNATGTAPNDTCGHADEDCMNGDCCRQSFHSGGQCCDRPCCGDVCCADGQACVNGTCETENRSCDASAIEDTTCLPGEGCTTGDSQCCTPDRVAAFPVDTGGGTATITFCCPYGQQFVRGPNLCCSAPGYCGMSRGSRVRF
jgi:hypothetical protein